MNRAAPFDIWQQSELAGELFERGVLRADWPAHLRWLADEYHGVAALFLHDYETQGGAFIDTAYIEQEYIEKYRELSRHNPWLPFVWRRRAGSLILGEALTQDSQARTKAESPEFYYGWMVPQNVDRGLGAILFKDADINPRWAIAVAVLRPDGPPGVGRYAPDEIHKFEGFIPTMMRLIRKHPAVIARLGEEGQPRLRATPKTLHFDEGGLLFGRTAGSLENNTKPIYDLLERGFVRLDSLAREFLSKLGVREHHFDLFLQLFEASREGNEAPFAAAGRALAEPAGMEPAAPPLALPDTIPEAQWYRHRPKGQSLRQFFDQGWPAPYLRGKVLTRARLRLLDPSAYSALYSTKEGAELPPDFLPTKPQLVDEELTHVDRELMREARRIESAQERRKAGLRRT